MRIVYRARQFWHALRAAPDESEVEAAQVLLGPALMPLFARLQPSEQAHSLHMLRQLLAQGEKDPDLLVAALLHDVGKTCYPLRIWERVWVVLARALFRAQVRAWGQGEPRGWRRSFVVAEQHPAWGAEMAARSGASTRVVALIRRHQDSSPHPAHSLEDRLLIKLQELDDQN